MAGHYSGRYYYGGQAFSDYGGYRSAINGLYQTMAEPQLYGENLTWGYLSALSQYYDSENSSNTMKFSYTEKYDYASDEVKAFGEQIWSTGYNVIANANNILQHLETADPQMFPNLESGEYDMIKAEAMAVRALIHFDLLRLFADAPVVNANAMAIPYSTKYPDYFPERKSTKKILDYVIADLNQAKSLLAPVDSLEGSLYSYISSTANRYLISNTGFGIFFSARGSRMNFVAVKSLLARVYAYAGDMNKAFDMASSVIADFVDSENQDMGYDWYSFTTSFNTADSEERRPHKLIDELLISFYSETLVQDYIDAGALGNSTAANPYKLKNISNIFADQDDYRQTKLIVNLTNDSKVSLKYRASAVNEKENKLLPVMRISELYLIMAEYYVSKGENEKAIDALTTIRSARNCLANDIDPASTSAQLNELIEKEMCRENVAEGQYFFFCKRKNLPTINNNGVYVPMEGKYTMLIPDSETSLN